MFKKIIPILFLSILFFGSLLFTKPEIAFAAPKTFDPQVNIGVTDLNVDGGLMGRYIEGIYKYSIGFVGILAAVVLMFGGFLWITAAGNGERVANAKAWIQAALSGLVLALCSYTILWYVNPDLVKFESITVKEAETNNTDGWDYVDSWMKKHGTVTIIGNDAEECNNTNCDASCKTEGNTSGGCSNNICHCVAPPEFSDIGECPGEFNCDIACEQRDNWLGGGCSNGRCLCYK